MKCITLVVSKMKRVFENEEEFSEILLVDGSGLESFSQYKFDFSGVLTAFGVLFEQTF